ncbi:MAG: putative sulfate exporter family transporter [Chelatococcus sp.]|nr:putative sulfate exporter family transporter [Chelatococcus sp. HY11]MBX3544435.1 putative sulfate exporter family transporter [Chelatococcus sp.]CAH1663231.1 putative membrane protein YeiH [Hyphomicrobiales bacterium]CAH1682334.1 putative membrane protein YeiH [Hyphomicrobiales bacterium]
MVSFVSALASDRRQFPAFTVLPGVALCAAIGIIAWLIEAVEYRISGHPYIEALVLAILIGAGIRAVWSPSKVFTPGIQFSAKTLLEVAVMMLGASLSATSIIAAGGPLLAGIAAVVVCSLFVSYALSRLSGLPHTMAVLIACGNSICGNSAIAAVASVMRADGNDVAAAVAFTALLGVLMVLLLPLSVPLLEMTELQYGAMAGLTVYAVPQVLAATMPVGLVSAQIGTLVKLIRVLMLGPVVFAAALASRDTGQGAVRLSFFKLVPWFVIGFAALSVARSLGLIPDAVIPVIRQTATVFTVLAMAALGLGVNFASLRKTGLRATVAVLASMAALLVMSYALVIHIPITL